MTTTPGYATFYDNVYNTIITITSYISKGAFLVLGRAKFSTQNNVDRTVDINRRTTANQAIVRFTTVNDVLSTVDDIDWTVGTDVGGRNLILNTADITGQGVFVVNGIGRFSLQGSGGITSNRFATTLSTATVTASQLIQGGILVHSNPGDDVWTLDLTTNILALFPSRFIGETFTFLVVNAAAANTVTLSPGDGSTTFVKSVVAIPAQQQRVYWGRISGGTAITIYG